MPIPEALVRSPGDVAFLGAPLSRPVPPPFARAQAAHSQDGGSRAEHGGSASPLLIGVAVEARNGGAWRSGTIVRAQGAAFEVLFDDGESGIDIGPCGVGAWGAFSSMRDASQALTHCLALSLRSPASLSSPASPSAPARARTQAPRS